MSHIRVGLATVALALGICVPSPVASPAPQVTRVGGFDQTQNWLRLARRHTGGSIDDVARQVATWSPAVLGQIIDDLQVVRLLVLQATRQGLVSGSGPSPAGRTTFAELRGKRLTLDQLAPLLGLTAEETGGPITPEAIARIDSPARHAIAQMMMRAALLHTDIAMAPPDQLPAAAAGRLAQNAVQLRDGRESAVGNIAIHYSVAREAVALVLPATAGAAVARQWYFATLAYLQGTRNYAALLPQLDTARVTMPVDSRVWLWSGVALENLAAPAVQVAAEGTSARIESPNLLFARAEQFYRHALELDPVCAECWLRLARVEQLSGHADEAAVMLARAEPKLGSPALKYYAALFAGRAAETLNKVPDARTAYERAMSLFPQAQSPRLALAELTFRDADQAQALSGVRTMFVTGGGRRDGDPWWIYDIALVTNWPDLVDDMRKAVADLVEGRK